MLRHPCASQNFDEGSNGSRLSLESLCGYRKKRLRNNCTRVQQLGSSLLDGGSPNDGQKKEEKNNRVSIWGRPKLRATLWEPLE